MDEFLSSYFQKAAPAAFSFWKGKPLESFVIEVLKWLLAKSDPMMISCFLILAIWQWRTAKLIAKHVDPKNHYPHPECEWGEKSYETLCEGLKEQRRENREDHQEIFSMLRGKK